MSPTRADSRRPNRSHGPTDARRSTNNRCRIAEGWQGWDEYAAFYDWENAQTIGRADLAFWHDFAGRVGGRTLELGCGTGRLLVPIARSGVEIVGIDRSPTMLARAHDKLRRLKTPTRASLVRGDIRHPPFDRAQPFDLVMAPYGVLQSLVRDRDLTATLRAVVDLLAPGGIFALDLVPDVPRWKEYSRRVCIRDTHGPRGLPVTLIESVRQDTARKLTIFDQEFVEGRGRTGRVHRFTLTFRTVGIRSLRRRLERLGLQIDAVLGSYYGQPWDERADVWMILASKPR
jgi:SAM-dependent methyltransferase